MIQLLQGDCIEMMKTLPDKSVDAIITDPPFGTTACKWDSVIPFEPMWEQLKRIIKPNGAIVLFGSQPFTSALVMSNPKMFKYEWIWEKTRASNPYLANIRPLGAHENVLIFGIDKINYKPQKTDGCSYAISKKSGGRVAGDKKTNNIDFLGKKQDGRFPRTVQRIMNSSSEAGLHPTQKPVALMEYLIKTYTNEGETVLDFTAGSGTTGVAAINTNRNAILIERDAGYCEIIKNRINEAEKRRKNNLFAGE
jgi:site-specific DNA-methyltransferase (adenine-specific)